MEKVGELVVGGFVIDVATPFSLKHSFLSVCNTKANSLCFILFLNLWKYPEHDPQKLDESYCL